MKNIAILGSTGSIGCSTLKIVEAYPERFHVVSLAAGRNFDLCLEQTLRWRPKMVSIASEPDAERLRSELKKAGADEIEVVYGEAGVVACATRADVDFVVSAIVGVGGMKATYEAQKLGKSIGLANKECMVAAGELFAEQAARLKKPILPIDSEHNAIHQCMRAGRLNEVERLWLTASGGPFLHTPQEQFASITVAQALNHPTWKMGQRITIDSATLMNKGFEVIEAIRLFNIAPEHVSVIVHPQSTVHSMVEYNDGSFLAQISVTDMRLPILYAMTWPDRVPSDLRFDAAKLSHLDFCPPDMDKFPCLRLAYEAVAEGGAKTVALNAADEIAVAAFLDEKIPFTGIAETIGKVLTETPATHAVSIEEVLQQDAEARLLAKRIIGA